MTREDALKYIELFKAAADGKILQYRDYKSGEPWLDIINITPKRIFLRPLDRLRIKPEPVILHSAVARAGGHWWAHIHVLDTDLYKRRLSDAIRKYGVENIREFTNRIEERK